MPRFPLVKKTQFIRDIAGITEASLIKKKTLFNTVGKAFRDYYEGTEFDQFTDVEKIYEEYFGERISVVVFELFKNFNRREPSGKLNRCIEIYLLAKLHPPYASIEVAIEEEIFIRNRKFFDEFCWEPVDFLDELSHANGTPLPDLPLRKTLLANRAHHYAAREHKVLGRDDEEAVLRRFIRPDSQKFRWMQIAGAGGQGKSRLAYDLVTEVSDSGELDAGFVEPRDLDIFSEYWDKWQPNKPTLIVIDYVLGASQQVGVAMNTLAYRAGKHPSGMRRLHYPVRLLLLERQRWDRGGLVRRDEFEAEGDGSLSVEASAEIGTADWFSAIEDAADCPHERLRSETFRFETGVVELKNLGEDHLVKIVRHLADAKGLQLAQDDQFITANLKRIDPSGRPLYAYFLSAALVAGDDITSWTREDLLRETIDRETKIRWRKADARTVNPATNPEAAKLAVLATILRTLDCDELMEKSDWAMPDDEAIQGAQILTDTPRDDDSPRRILNGLEPDILGEYFVIDRFGRNVIADEVICIAWNINPKATAQFLVRISQDFQTYYHLFDTELNIITPHHPIISIASEICKNLRSMTIDPPKNLINYTVIANQFGHKGARIEVAFLGLCVAPLGPKNIEIRWQFGAEQGCVKSIYYLGIAYWQGGVHIDKNCKLAFEYFYQAAKLGHADAMEMTARCFLCGFGIQRDESNFIYWFEKAEKAGSTSVRSFQKDLELYGISLGDFFKQKNYNRLEMNLTDV